uniref:Cas9 inhibitor AcrIIA9 family protein n=1 Tax=Thomasclavelia spiroformis TaxID=29348 RepID=UPI00359C885E
MSLWELLNDQKEDKEATEKVEKEVAKEPEIVEKPKATKKTIAKKAAEKKEETASSKKEYKSLEEQVATVPDNLKTKIDVIYRYLMTVPGMDAKMRNPNKNITDMFKYIENQARKQAVNGCAMIEDQEVFGWAVHYYDEDSVK